MAYPVPLLPSRHSLIFPRHLSEVETVPVVIKKLVKKEEAETIIAKLKEVGAVVVMVGLSPILACPNSKCARLIGNISNHAHPFKSLSHAIAGLRRRGYLLHMGDASDDAG
eukprot:2630266-Pyramimonas_sp.AAC.1